MPALTSQDGFQSTFELRVQKLITKALHIARQHLNTVVTQRLTSQAFSRKVMSNLTKIGKTRAILF